MASKKNTGLFFGSFNPIHIGHLAIANYIVEFTDLDEIWFVVSPQNPLKSKQSLLADYHRLEIVNLAIEKYDFFKASDIEFNLPQPSYTIDTLTYIYEKYPNRDFVIIMGMDSLQNINKWKNYEQIFNYYKILVYPRPNYNGGEFIDHPKVEIVNAPLMEVSSSFIRKSIKEGKDISCFLPEKAYQYIKEMHFYEK
ncbi:MAG: nicotinate-nucleotide adenylyltransferase [Saprospiraceae bacterium]|nr:nicotinate-nucleotide adenylyltransferase [Saprospiraceae bacterium]